MAIISINSLSLYISRQFSSMLENQERRNRNILIRGDSGSGSRTLVSPTAGSILIVLKAYGY